MKKYILCACALLSVLCGSAASEASDTLVYTAGVDSVVIKDSDTFTSIVLYGKDGGENMTYMLPKPEGSLVRTFKSPLRKRKKAIGGDKESKWDVAFGGLGFGWNLALDKNPASMHVASQKSWDITWLYAIGAQYKIRSIGADISFGLGFDWKNYKTHIAPWFVPSGNSVALGPIPEEGAVMRSSRLKVFSLSVPVLYRQSLGFSFPFCQEKATVAVGPILNFSTHGSLLNRYTLADGTLREQTTNHIGQRKVSVDIYGAFFFNSWLGAYVRYSPQTILASGPQFKSLTIGLTLSWF